MTIKPDVVAGRGERMEVGTAQREERWWRGSAEGLPGGIPWALTGPGHTDLRRVMSCTAMKPYQSCP